MSLYRDRSAAADATVAAADAFIAALVQTPDDLLATWVVNVLMALEPWVVESTYADVLADLRERIDGRLARGAW